MPVEKAGQLLVELNKAEIAGERLELDYKKKMQLAFESKIMDEVKKYPEIKEKFTTAFKELKGKMQEN